MYAKYTTDAIVLCAYERGESDRTVVLYTRDYGLVRARASSVRSASSTMRGAIVSGAHSTVSLVKGKAGWRLAGAIPLSSGLPAKRVRAFARLTKLIERLVQGEEANTPVFDVLVATRAHLCREVVKELSVELIAVARVLHALGYLSAEAVGSALFVETTIAEESLDEVERQRVRILGAVNSAIAASQL